MKRAVWFAVVALVVAALSACGQQPAASENDATGNAPAASSGGGMDHGGMASADAEAAASPMGMASSAATSASGEAAAASSAGGMDHGAMGSANADAPYDARFIDSMIEHHTGAITMAEQALEESERPEIRELAQNIIDTQRQEVDQMQQWRSEWYADLAPTGGMGMDMGDMEVGGDASVPFDQRFITAMVAHHQGAIAMAKDAQQNAEHAEIKELAGNIITAQEAEIRQLKEWEKAWFGQ